MKLMVLDIEGTLFKTNVRLPDTLFDSTIWQAIASALGPQAIKEEIETHKKWTRGEYNSYLDWMKNTITIHQRYKLSREIFMKIISSAEYNPGVVDTLNKINRSEYEFVLISGGFSELAARAQKDLRIVHAFAACEYIFGENGFLESYNLLPCDFEGKIDFIKLMLREYGLGPNDWIFIGDGANDVPIAKEAQISVGYRAHDSLKQVVTYDINEFQELLAILN